MAAEPAIAVQELRRNFGEFVAVDGVSFDVARGEIFGFLGPNGAGKTTTISMLCTLLRPSGGRALIGGHDVARESDAVRRQIGIVFQDATLDDRLTAQENLTFHGEIYGMTRADIRERASEMLARVGLEDRKDSLVMTYSGGMKRRLEIARGLLHHPTALFLDEPTIGLDPQTRRSLWEYAQSLRDAEGVTIFLTTHYMDEAEACDRIAIIDHGKIIALDTPSGLKGRLGGDVVTVSGEDNAALAGEIQARFGLEPRVTDEDVEFRVDRGDQFVPQLFAQLSSVIQTVSIRRPTLDDVFVTLTGREIRDEGASEGDMARFRLRTRGGPPGMGRRGTAAGGRP